MFTKAAVVAGKHNIRGFWNPARAPVDGQQFQHRFCHDAADARSRSYRWWPVRSLTVRESDILLRASSWLGHATSKTNFLLDSIVISCGEIYEWREKATSKWKRTLTSESRNKSGINPRRKQPTNIATDITVIVKPPSMMATSLSLNFKVSL